LQYKPIILAGGKTYQIEPKLFAALIYIEGGYPERCPDGPWTASCTSNAGAIGPAQVMPFNFPDGVDGRDPAINILRGMELLQEYMGDFDGDVRSGLAAYNCGPTRLITESPATCWKYADDVLHQYNSR
jgi:hypothetical protein